ncbi:MAG: VWA domain-containing protein [Actinomycetota bacterium]|nr:VWA domain-containing protein [Actinomycetota bacterium]
MRIAAFVATLALAAPATAAAEIRRVDATSYPKLRVVVVSPSVAAPRLFEDGKPVAGLEAENLGRAKSVVLAIDRSQSMRGTALGDAVAAVRSFVRSKSSGDRVAIVGFGSTALQLTRFSSSTIDADIALRDLSVDSDQGTALNDAVALGARLLGSETTAARVLLVVTDGRDVSSAISAAEAARRAREHGVTVYTVGIESEQFSPAPLKELAEATGGLYRGAESSSELVATYGSIAAELRKTWQLTYVTAARPGEDVSLRVSGDEAKVTVPGRAAATRVEKPELLPEHAYTSRWGSVAVGGAVGLLLLLALVFVAGAKRASWLKTRLAPHLADTQLMIKKERRNTERFAAGSALLRATERAFEHLAWWKQVQRQLERADVPLRTSEFLWLTVAASFVVGLVAAFAARSSIFILGGFAVGAALPFGVLKFKAMKRLKAFENQLPDLLLTMAASLKAGHSFKQGLQTIVDEGQEPASKEFQRVLTEARLGRPMDDALTDMSERVASKNLRFVITAVTIQSQVGGSLAGLFDMVADTVRQRQQFARKIKGLTAMGRASAYVLVGLPIFLAGLLTLLNSEFMAPLWHTSTGHKLIFAGLGMMTVGSLMLKRIVSFRG